MLTGLDHVTVLVRDLDAAIARQRDLLGSVASWRGQQADLGVHAALFGLSNCAVELVSPDASALEAEGLRQALVERGEGPTALAFGVADAAALSTEFKARGLRATAPEPGEARGEDGSTRSYRTVELSRRTTRRLNVYAVERSDPAAVRARAPVPPDAVDALDHVVVRTRDPDAAIALYRDGLGIRLALDRDFKGTRMLFFRSGGVTLEVVHDPALGDADVLHGLAYRVRDIDAAHERVRARGFSVSEPRAGNKPGTRVFTVKDAPGAVPTLFLRDPSRD